MKGLIFTFALLMLVGLPGCATVPENVGTSATDVQPKLISRALPIYPFELHQAGITGQVIVSFFVNRNGDVVDVKAVSSTNRGFELSAVSAVSRWKFSPGIKDGQPVMVAMTVPIYYNLP